MIVGAGTSGSVILKEMTTSSLVNGCVVCFVDDDKNLSLIHISWYIRRRILSWSPVRSRR